MEMHQITRARLMDTAAADTGLSDFGEPSFEEGLARLLDALHASATTLTSAGVHAAHDMIVEVLRNRLLLRNSELRDPSTSDIAIESPVFILGLPRSGTTFLHNLLAQHPKLRAPLYWELRHPVSPIGRPAYAIIGDVQASLNALYAAAPELRAIHPQNAEQPDECTWLLANEFASPVFGFAFDVPNYLEWVRTADLLYAFRSHRRQLQHILWRRPGTTPLVLKDPYHGFYLDQISTIYPDARFLFVRRTPTEVLSSLCSLCERTRTLHHWSVDRAALAKQMSAMMAELIAVQYRWRRDNPENGQVHDLEYNSLIADPIAEATRIFRFLALECSPQTLDLLTSHVTRHPQHSFGAHHHSLEQFGLDHQQTTAMRRGE